MINVFCNGFPFQSVQYSWICVFLFSIIFPTASTQELEPLCAEENVEKYVSYAFAFPLHCILKIESNRIVSCRKSEFTAKRTGRPFSQYAYDIKLKNAHTEKENFGFTADNSNKIDNKTLVNGGPLSAQLWYRDVVELRKKAEEYKVRCACLQSFRLFLFWNVHFCFCFALESWLGHWDQSGTL